MSHVRACFRGHGARLGMGDVGRRFGRGAYKKPADFTRVSNCCRRLCPRVGGKVGNLKVASSCPSASTRGSWVCEA